MRLIDGDALIERLKQYKDKYGADKFPYDIVHDAFIYEVEKEPTVDAVPVIRCRDCKNFHDEWGNKWCYITQGRTNEDRFCSSAEKIED